MTWKTEAATRERKAYHAIKCFTCNQLVPTRAYLKQHKNHDVHYIDKDGNIDE